MFYCPKCCETMTTENDLVFYCSKCELICIIKQGKLFDLRKELFEEEKKTKVVWFWERKSV